MVYWQYGFEKGKEFITLPWLAIEKSLTHKTSFSAILFASPTQPVAFRKDHFILLNTQKIWNQIRKHSALPLTSVHAPIWQNHNFFPSLTDTAFREWSCRGITSLEDLHFHGQLVSFEQLQSKFSILRSHLF